MTRVALVTGGTRGLGRAISIALKDAGFRVGAVFHSNEQEARSFSDATGITAFQWNVADFQACADGVSNAQQQLGPIDVLVNNAGITRDAMLHRMEAEQWLQVINTNLGSVFNMCRNVIDGMRSRQYGRIINISSINGEKGQMGQTNYAAAKAGMLGFTRALALENASRNVTVNAIAPGYCDTDMVRAVPDEILAKIVAGIPVARLGTPQDIARMAVFLAAEEASFITGATFDINGGQYMR